MRATAGSGVAGQGGEDILLDEFENLGLHCDPATQVPACCCCRCSSATCQAHLQFAAGCLSTVLLLLGIVKMADWSPQALPDLLAISPLRSWW